jgi:hypothetical protein
MLNELAQSVEQSLGLSSPVRRRKTKKARTRRTYAPVRSARRPSRKTTKRRRY